MKVIDEMERIYDVTGGVNGCYEDPQNDRVFIIKTDEIVMKIPKEFLNHADKIKELYKND